MHTQHTHIHIHVQVDVLVHTPVYKLLVHNIVRHENQSESAFLTCYLPLHNHTVEWCYTICMYTVYRTSTPNTYMHTPHPPHTPTQTHTQPPTSRPLSSMVSVFQSTNILGLSFCATDTTDSTLVRFRMCIAFFSACLTVTPGFACTCRDSGWIWRTKLVEY